MNIYLIKHRHLFNKLTFFCLYFFFFMIIASLPNNVLAQKISTGINIQPEEMAELPRWCQIRMTAHPRMRGTVGSESVPDYVMRENEKWEKVIGDPLVYNSVHHYCWGVNLINRYRRSSIFSYENVEEDRKRLINRALVEFKYMHGHGERLKKSSLYKPLLMREAYLYSEQGDAKETIVRYQEIITRYPGYASAYVEYANFLYSVGNTSDAVNILKSGLEKTNGAQSIKQALSTLEGESTKE